MKTGKILYAKKDKYYFIKLIGNLRFDIGADLEALIDAVFADPDMENVMLDLTESEYFDSTILGMLAKAANLMFEKNKQKVTVLSTNNNINYLLSGIGLDEVFIVVDDCDYSPETFQDAPNIDSTEAELAIAILNAHRRLRSLNEKNAEEFKDVVELLEQEAKLKK